MIQEDDPASDITPAACQAFCGRVEAVVPDDGAGTVWLLTSSHAITLDLPNDATTDELPRKGEPVFYNRDLDVVALGQQDAQRVFCVARKAWGFEGSPHGADTRMIVLALSVVSVLMLLVSFALLANAFFHVVSSSALDSEMACLAMAITSVAALLQWKLVVPHWTSRSMIGIAPRPDIAVVPGASGRGHASPMASGF